MIISTLCLNNGSRYFLFTRWRFSLKLTVFAHQFLTSFNLTKKLICKREKRSNLLFEVRFRFKFKTFLLLYCSLVNSYLTRFFLLTLVPSLLLDTNCSSLTQIFGYLSSWLWKLRQCTALKLTQSEWPLLVELYVLLRQRISLWRYLSSTSCSESFSTVWGQ